MRSLCARFSIFLIAVGSFAQSNQGRITGTISDPAGAVIPTAQIEVKNTETGVVYRGGTSDTGNYVLPVPSGTYEITVSAAGFKKFVVSNTLKSAAAWRDSNLISGDVIAEIRKLKSQPGKNIILDGSSVLVHALIENDLVDEISLHVYPLVLGMGKRLFPEGKRVNLRPYFRPVAKASSRCSCQMPKLAAGPPTFVRLLCPEPRPGLTRIDRSWPGNNSPNARICATEQAVVADLPIIVVCHLHADGCKSSCSACGPDCYGFPDASGKTACDVEYLDGVCVKLAEAITCAFPRPDRDRPILDSLLELLAWVPTVLEYRSGTTEVHGALTEAVRQGSGVCQDFAHLFITVARSWGIPARYVMGYLDPGICATGEELATHAWAEALVAQSVVRAITRSLGPTAPTPAAAI